MLKLSPCRLRFILLVIAAPVVSPVTASAQAVHSDVAVLVARYGPGVEASVGLRRFAVFARAEGITTRIVSMGLRGNVYSDDGGAVYVSAAIGGGSCARTGIGGSPTGCDGEWHDLAAGALGVRLRTGRQWSIFAEGGIMAADTPDIALFTGAAGIRFSIPDS